MNPCERLEKGTVIKVINPDHPSYGKIAFIHSMKSDDLYHIQMTDGQEILLFAEEMAPWKRKEQKSKLRMWG